MISRNTILALDAITRNPNLTHVAHLHWVTENGNPNGDPDTGGVRLDADGHALCTDVKVKRAIRNYLEDVHGRLMYIPRDLQALMGPKPDGSYWMLKDWVAHHQIATLQTAQATLWDLRAFGGVIGLGGKKKKAPKKGKAVEESGETEAQDEDVDNSKTQVTGPVQILTARSLDPVEECTMTITRCASEEASKARTMGSRRYVPFAEFVQTIRYGGLLGHRAGMSEQDMVDLWEAACNGLEHSASTMRGDQYATRIVIHSFRDAIGTWDPNDESTRPVVTTLDLPRPY
jgi:CRISPR/Cas system type I-B associated protein Csh2 (Cas7 group RAMP superfamily)